jgi:protein O-mannosyl-transferase
MTNASELTIPTLVADMNYAPARQLGRALDRRIWLVAIPLAIFVVSAFLPALDNGFVNWDDDKNLLDNPFFRGLGANQVKWACTTFWLGVYQPLAWLLFEAQYVFCTLDPRGYHLTSIILHAVNTVVLYVLTVTLLSRCQTDLCQKRPWTCFLGAGLATALFAVHPLRVEAVAWASCQPYLPCALFSMLAVLAYLRAFEMGSNPQGAWLVAAFVLFVAALLSHAVALSLPAVLLILDVYPLRRFGDASGRWFGLEARRVCLEKVPFIVVSLAFTGVAIAARTPALISTRQHDVAARIAQVCFGIWFYLKKTVLPLDLAAVYPSPRQIDCLASPFIESILAMVAMSGAVFVMRRRWPGLVAVWVSYLVILAPNLGILRSSENVAADRYSYMAMLGWVVLVAGCLCRLGQSRSRLRPGAMGITVLGLTAVVGLVPITWNQCKTWRDSKTLWSHALAHGAGSSAEAHYNLGHELYRSGNFGAAAAQYAQALRINPADAAVHNNLGVALSRQGKFDNAAAHFSESLRFNPDYLDSHYNLGMVLSRQGKFEEAAAHYTAALRLNPDFASAHHNLGIDLSHQGKLAEAAVHYTEALRLNPRRVDTHTNLGVVLSSQGNFAEAAAHYVEALRLNPRYDEAWRCLEHDRARQRELEAAATH